MHFESRTQYHNCAEIVVTFVLAPGFFSEIIGFFFLYKNEQILFQLSLLTTFRMHCHISKQEDMFS